MILGSPCWLGDFIGTASFGGPKGKRDSFFLLSIPFLVTLGSLILTQGIVCLQISKSSSLGGQQILDCELNFPNGILVAYTITWTKDGLKKPVLFNYYGYAPQIHENFAGRVRLVNGISLEISHIREEDEGWYECKVLYLDGIENNKKNGTWIYLNVNVPPKILDNTPTSFHQPQGTEVRLFCTGTGSPKPTITWTKDEVPLRTSQRIALKNDDSEVIIHNLHEDDGGIYKCRFKNAVGQMTQSIHLIVEGQAYIIQPPVNRTAVLGQRIQFTCLAEGYPNNITYRWYKDNRNVNTLPGYLSRFIIFADGSLIITMVDKVDMGWYTCRPSNGMGQDPEATAYLNVTYSPEVLKNKMTQHLIWALGFFEKLDCPVDANPPVYQFVWTKNGLIVDFTPSKLTLAPNGSLLINKVEESDARNYRCTAISSVGRGESDIVQVEVKDPPHFTVRPDSQYIRQLAQTVVMPCAAIGTPAPTITWRKVGGSLDFDDRIQKLHGNLTINSLQKDDYGIYECEAANEVRKIITSTELIIQNTTPYAPYNVSVSTQLFSATVRWIPAYSSTPQHYLIWFRSVNGEISQWQTMMVEPQNATRFTLYNLEPDTTYEFMVLSRNNLGDGQYSEKVRAKTLGYTDDMATALPTDSSGNFYIPPIVKPLGPRPSPPRNLSVSGDPLGIVLSWLPPENTSVPIFYYTVEYRTDGDWVSEQSNVLHPNTSYILKPVLAGKTYQFRVISYGVLAYSYPSEYIAFTVPPEEGFRLSEAEIGGIVGGLLFLIIAVTLAVIAVICSRRRDRKQNARYGNVKYRGPADDVDSHKPINKKVNIRQNGVTSARIQEDTL